MSDAEPYRPDHGPDRAEARAAVAVPEAHRVEITTTKTTSAVRWASREGNPPLGTSAQNSSPLGRTRGGRLISQIRHHSADVPPARRSRLERDGTKGDRASPLVVMESGPRTRRPRGVRGRVSDSLSEHVTSTCPPSDPTDGFFVRGTEKEESQVTRAVAEARHLLEQPRRSSRQSARVGGEAADTQREYPTTVQGLGSTVQMLI